MLQFVSTPVTLKVDGASIRRFLVQVEVRGDKNVEGIKFDMRVDTGSDRTTLPLAVASQIGLDPEEIKANCTPIKASGAVGTITVDGYVKEVWLKLEDDYFGMAEWKAEVTFCDPPLKTNLAGMQGFLELLRLTDKGSTFCLDPIARFPGRCQCTVVKSGSDRN